MRKQTKIAAITSAAALLAIGASMTAFAAAGWTTDANGYRIYRDSDGEPEAGWHRDREYGNALRYADEDGYMVTNSFCGTEGPEDMTGEQLFYLDENGFIKTDWWQPYYPEDGETEVNDQLVDVVWYYFGSNGQAKKAKDTYTVVKDIPVENDSATKGIFIFDNYGQMVTGDVEITDDNGNTKYYYCLTTDDKTNGRIVPADSNSGFGDFLTGRALTGWFSMETVDEDNYFADSAMKWFYFNSDGSRNSSPLHDGGYYVFNSDGSLITENAKRPATDYNAEPDEAVQYLMYIDGVNGGLSKNDWQHLANDNWYYLTNIRDQSGKVTVRGAIFNGRADGTEKKYAAKKVAGETYVFNGKGLLVGGYLNIASTELSDIYQIGNKWYWQGIEALKLEAGEYYFHNTHDGHFGEREYGQQKFTLDDDDETHVKYFYDGAIDAVSATNVNGVVVNGTVRNAVVDGYLYDTDGELVKAVDDNYMLYPIASTSNGIPVLKTSKGKLVTVTEGTGDSKKDVVITTTGADKADGDDDKDGTYYVVVDKNGKIVKSKTTVELYDGSEYSVSQYYLTAK